MPSDIQLKVCGLTSASDAEAAVRAGADYLGFNLYPPSPRYLPLDRYRALAPSLPAAQRVAVMVEPTDADLTQAREAGFDSFQIHFRPEIPPERLAAWSKAVGRSRLFLAPRLPPAEEVQAAWLPLADFFLLDAFSPDLFGGTGRTSDWEKFTRHRRAHPATNWMLSGGLSPANLAEALRLTDARMIDLNSGVETSPGVKDHAKLAASAAVLRARADGA